MMSFEEYQARADRIDWEHRHDLESKSHIDDLMRLYIDYGNVRASDIPKQFRSVSGEDDNRDGTDRDNESDEA